MVNRLLGRSFDPARSAQRLSAVGQRGPRATSPPVYVRSSVGTVPSLAQAARAHGPDRGSAPRGAGAPGGAGRLGAAAAAPTKAAIAAALHARTRGAGGAGGAAPSDDHIFRFLLKHFATRAAANAKEAADADAWEAVNPRYAALCHALYDSMQDGGPYADAYFVRGAPAASPDSSDTESGTGAVQPGAGDAESDDDDAGAG